MDKQSLSRRLETLVKDRGWSEAKTAEIAGTTQSTIHRLLNEQIDSPRIGTIGKLAAAFNVTTAFLIHGTEDANTEVLPANYSTETSNAYTVPLIDWSDLGTGIDTSKKPQILCAAPHSTSSYALKVEGNTMQSSQGKSYPEGAFIFIEPEHNAQNGDKIIAKILDGNIYTFKQLAVDAGMQYLQSLNLQYPPITREFEIVGTVIGTWIPEG
jgi:SOS-response transcriptional repressor LexA